MPITASASSSTTSFTWPCCTLSFQCPESVWVSIEAPPSNYAFDEALLLCQEDEGRWLAWVPGHGEIVVDLRTATVFG